MANTRTINSVVFNPSMSINETYSIGTDPLTANLSAVVASGRQWSFDGTQGPLRTKKWSGEVTLVAGAAILDLTSLADSILGTVDMTGLKLLCITAQPNAANTHVITIAAGASNGYTGWGSIVDYGALGPLNHSIAIDGTHKTLDIAGNTTEKLDLIMLFG